MNIPLLQSYSDKFVEMSLTYVPKIFVAIITLWIGHRFINWVVKKVKAGLSKKKIDASLKSFIGSLVKIILLVALYISIADYLGIKTTSFVAVLGAAGLAIGMALQGALGNFAGGALILIFRPFRVGDYIEAMGYGGTVKEIQIFCTVLLTADRKTIMLPNGPLSNTSLVNFSLEPVRRVDMVFGIGYGDDIKKAKELLIKIADEDSRIHKDPAPTIAVHELAASSVNFVFRVFVNSDDYWKVYFDTQEKVKLTFDEQGISIPFPQTDIHVRHVQQ